jgi:hypothetical protein
MKGKRFNTQGIMEPDTGYTFPDYIFYAMTLTFPLEQMSTIAYGSITKWIGLVFFLFSFFNVKRYYGHFPKFFFFYLTALFIGISEDLLRCPYYTFELLNDIARPLLLFLLLVITYNMALNGKDRQIIFFLFLAATLFSLAQFVGIESDTTVQERVGGELYDRVAVFENNQNAVARYCALTILFGVVYGMNLVKSSIFLRVVGILSAVVGFLALLKTASRGGFLALAIGVIMILFTSKRLTKKIVLLVALGLLGTTALFYTMQDTLFMSRIEKSYYERSTGGRTDIWIAAFSLVPEAPLFGHGMRSHTVALGAKLGLWRRATHNSFIAFLVGTGIIGFLLFMIFYIKVAWRSWRCRMTDTGPIVFVWFMMATAGAMSMNVEGAKWYYMVIALVLAVDQRVQAERQRRLLQPWYVGQ